MKNVRAVPSIGGIIGIILTVIFALAGGVALYFTLLAALAPAGDGANLGTFGLGLVTLALFGIAALIIYYTMSYFRLRYSLDRNAITIDLGNRKQLIPLANVRHVLPAENVLELLRQQNTASGAAKPNPLGTNGTPPRRERVYARPRNAATEGITTDAADSSTEDDFIVQGSVLYDAQTLEHDVSTAEEDITDGQVVEVDASSVRAAADGGENRPDDEPDSEDADYREINSDDPTPARTAVNGNYKVKTKLFTAWPGYYVNRGWLPGLGEIKFYSTTPFAKTLLVRTDTNTYAISPRDPQSFLTEYKLRRNLGPTESVVEGIAPGVLLSHPLWRDWVGRVLILLGVLISLSLFVYLLATWNDIEEILRIHYNKFGEVDRLAPRGDIMWLPFIGLLAAVFNSVFGAYVHVRDRAAALLLYSATLAVQLAVWVAVIGIIITRQPTVQP